MSQRLRLFRVPTSAAVILTLALLTPPPATAGFIWGDVVDATDAASGFNAILKKIALSTTSGDPEIHGVMRQWEDGENENTAAEGLYLPADSAASWATSWADAWAAREPFTLVDSVYITEFDVLDTIPRASTDHQFEIDNSDDFHVFSEVFNYEPSGLATRIGYKRRGGTFWPDSSISVFVSLDDSCECFSPRTAFEDNAGTDSIHIAFRAGKVDDERCADSTFSRRGWMGYNVKSVTADDDDWNGVTWVTDRIKPIRAEGAQMMVDSNGIVHFFSLEEGVDSTRFVHLEGTPPSTPGATWSTPASAWDTLSTYPNPSSFPLVDSDAPTATVSSGASVFNLAWSQKRSNGEKEVFFAQFNPDSGTWLPPYRISTADNVTAPFPVLATAGDGTVHVLYHEGKAGSYDLNGANETRIFHRFSTNVSDSTDWSAPTEVTIERVTSAKRPTIVAVGDTAYVGYQDYDATGSVWTGKFRTGFKIDNSVASGDTMTWFGNVFLEDDFVVESGGTLIVEAGTRVFADRAADDPVEVLVQGQILADGGTSAADQIVFSSWASDHEDTTAWSGLAFDLVGAEHAGYGYWLAEEPISELKNVKVEGADYGLRIANAIAPNLENIEFDDIKSGFEVLLDSCDVFIPAGHDSVAGSGQGLGSPRGRWDVEGPFDVVARDSVSSTGDAAGYNSGRVDFSIDGLALLSGPNGAINFRSESADTQEADDWGGVTINSEAKGSVFDSVTVAYAKNPLFLFYPDSVTVKNSRIFAFAETGVWVDGTTGDGLLLESLLVDRGDVDDAIGDLGIFLDDASHVDLLNSEIDLTGLEVLAGGRGLRAAFSKTFCQQSGGSEVDSLSIERNLIVGPGLFNDGSYTGLEMYWICGENGVREIEVLDNGLYSWDDVAMRFDQTGDVQVSCNAVADVVAAVDLTRDGQPTATPVRLRDNTLDAIVSVSDYVVRTDDAVKIKLGPAGATRGYNLLTARNTGVDFVLENDADSTDVLNAQGNYWYTDSLGVKTLRTDADSIEARIDTNVPDDARVDVTSFFTTDPFASPCAAPAHPDSSPSALMGRPQDTLIETEDGRSSDQPDTRYPSILELGRFAPNPSRGGASAMLSVPPGATGRFQVRVFDVAGRLVAGAERHVPEPGRFPVEWNGQSDAGTQVAAGVYFVSVSGPGGFRATRKLTVLE